jgi:hypothetical protein
MMSDKEGDGSMKKEDLVEGSSKLVLLSGDRDAIVESLKKLTETGKTDAPASGDSAREPYH